MTRKMDSCSYQIPDAESLVIVKESVKNAAVFLWLNAILFAEQLLHLLNTLSDTNRRPVTLFPSNLVLQIERCGEMVGVGMRFEDPVHLVTFLASHGEQRIGGTSADYLSDWIIVQHRIYDHSGQCGWIGDQVLPCSCVLFKYAMNDRLPGYWRCGAV